MYFLNSLLLSPPAALRADPWWRCGGGGVGVEGVGVEGVGGRRLNLLSKVSQTAGSRKARSHQCVVGVFTPALSCFDWGFFSPLMNQIQSDQRTNERTNQNLSQRLTRTPPIPHPLLLLRDLDADYSRLTLSDDFSLTYQRRGEGGWGGGACTGGKITNQSGFWT